jgi:hypothetical protein
MALLSALAAVALGAPAAPALKPHLIFMLGDGELQPALTIPPSPSPARTAPAQRGCLLFAARVGERRYRSLADALALTQSSREMQRLAGTTSAGIIRPP